MRSPRETRTGYLLAVAAGALIGGSAVLVATDAISKVIPQLMSAMMTNMMREMSSDGCNPEEM